jgi:hypothetical protein
MKRRWSSVDESLYGDTKHIVCGAGGLFDAVVILDRSSASGSLGRPHRPGPDSHEGGSGSKGAPREWGRFLPVRMPGASKGVEAVQPSGDDGLSPASEGKGQKQKRMVRT